MKSNLAAFGVLKCSFLFMCMYSCVCLCVCVDMWEFPQKPEEDVESSEAGTTDSCELPDMCSWEQN